MNPEDFWRTLQEDWQSASPEVDLTGLKREVRRKRRQMQGLQTLEVLLALVATGFMIRMLLTVHKPHAHLLFWALLVIVWASLAAGAWWRFTTRKPQGMDAESLLKLIIRRARAGFRFIWLNVAGLLVIYAVALPFFWQWFSNGDAIQRRAVVVNLVLNAGVLVITVAWGLWYGRRQRRKIRRAQAMLRQLEQDNGDIDEHL